MSYSSLGEFFCVLMPEVRGEWSEMKWWVLICTAIFGLYAENLVLVIWFSYAYQFYLYELCVSSFTCVYLNDLCFQRFQSGWIVNMLHFIFCPLLSALIKIFQLASQHCKFEVFNIEHFAHVFSSMCKLNRKCLKVTYLSECHECLSSGLLLKNCHYWQLLEKLKKTECIVFSFICKAQLSMFHSKNCVGGVKV